MTISSAAALVALIASVGILLDTAEILYARRTLSQFFDWKTSQRYRRWPTLGLSPVAETVREPLFKILVAAHSVAAVASALALLHNARYTVLAIIFVIGVRCLIEYRFPRSNTAADQLQLLIWVGLAAFSVFEEGGLGQVVALSFIAAHGLLAYFSAGVAKLFRKAWRKGKAVGQVLETDTYGTPTLASIMPIGLFSLFSLVASWSTIALEIGGPALILFGPDAAAVFIGMAALFHIGIAFTMGLTPFIFAFGATYPAIYWLAHYIQSIL